MRGGRTYVNSRGRIKNKIDLGKIKALLNLIFVIFQIIFQTQLTFTLIIMILLLLLVMVGHPYSFHQILMNKYII